MKESKVKSSSEVLKSDKLSKQDGCTEVKDLKKIEIESLQNELINNSSDVETSKETLTIGNSLVKVIFCV